MRTWIVITTLLLCAVNGVLAGKPQLSIDVQNGSFDDFGGFDPTVSWSSSAKWGDFDVEYGVDVNARATTEISTIPKKVWGKAKTILNGGKWLLTARAETEDMTNFDVDLDAHHDPTNVRIHLETSAGGGDGRGNAIMDRFALNKVEATKIFNDFVVSPRYNIVSESGELFLSYDGDETKIEATVSTDRQEVKLSQQIDAYNRISPTFASDGDVALEWERKLGEDKMVTTTLRPNDSIKVIWKDEEWTANVDMPIEGTIVVGANVGIRRHVDLNLGSFRRGDKAEKKNVVGEENVEKESLNMFAEEDSE